MPNQVWANGQVIHINTVFHIIGAEPIAIEVQLLDEYGNPQVIDNAIYSWEVRQHYGSKIDMSVPDDDPISARIRKSPKYPLFIIRTTSPTIAMLGDRLDRLPPGDYRYDVTVEFAMRDWQRNYSSKTQHLHRSGIFTILPPPKFYEEK